MGGNDFQCTQCGLLLDPQQASGEYVITEPTIVRALLSPPQRTRTMELPRPPPQRPTPHDLATARFTVPMDTHTVPHLRAGLDIALQPLHPFEAHIASFIDGDHAVPDLARAARLPEIEVKVVLKALLERGVVELHRLPGAPAMRTMTDELPILDGQDFLVPEPMALGDEEPPARPVLAMRAPHRPLPPTPTRAAPPQARPSHRAPSGGSESSQGRRRTSSSAPCGWSARARWTGPSTCSHGPLPRRPKPRCSTASWPSSWFTSARTTGGPWSCWSARWRWSRPIPSSSRTCSR